MNVHSVLPMCISILSRAVICRILYDRVQAMGLELARIGMCLEIVLYSLPDFINN